MTTESKHRKLDKRPGKMVTKLCAASLKRRQIYLKKKMVPRAGLEPARAEAH